MGLYVYTGPPILAPAPFRNPEKIPGNNPRRISDRIQQPSRHKDPS